MTSQKARQIKASYEANHLKLAETLGIETKNEILLEAYSQAVQALLASDDEGWTLISGALDRESKGLSLKDAQEITCHLEKVTKLQGGLLGRGLRLKNNHVFGRGFKFERADGEIQPRFNAIINDPDNQESVFSLSAAKELNRILFTSGNLLVLFHKSGDRARKFQRLSIDLHIANWLAEEGDEGYIKYYLRQWTTRDDLTATGKSTVHQEWVPTARYAATNPKYPATIKVGNQNVKVNKNAVIIDKRINKDNGEVWGVADAFSAAPWATLYANYLRDGAKVFHALAAISYLVKAKTERAAKAAGAKLQNGRVGQAAITGPETEISSIPRSGAQDLYEGRPIQAQVASNLDVSVTGLASDPGLGGSYASESALSQPEQMAALSRQEDFSDFYSALFRVMGAPDIRVNWARIDHDPVHRQMQSLGMAYTLGGIHQDELRDRALELLDVTPSTQKLPEPNEFVWAKKGILPSFLTDDEDLLDLNGAGGTNGAAGDGSLGSGLPSQGNSGAVGSLDDSGNSMAQDDNAAGTA